MLTENESLDNSHDVLFVFRVVVPELFEDSGLDQTLLV